MPGSGPATRLSSGRFVSYAYPEPAGFRDRAATPGTHLDATPSEFILPYDRVRTAADPDALLLDFLSTTFAAAAANANDRSRSWPKSCSAARYGGYYNPEVDALIDRQSIETDLEKRRRLVWEIERTLIEDDVRPVLFHPRAAVCNQPWVKGMTQMVNGIYNGARFEDVWLDK